MQDVQKWESTKHQNAQVNFWSMKHIYCVISFQYHHREMPKYQCVVVTNHGRTVFGNRNIRKWKQINKQTFGQVDRRCTIYPPLPKYYKKTAKNKDTYFLFVDLKNYTIVSSSEETSNAGIHSVKRIVTEMTNGNLRDIPPQHNITLRVTCRRSSDTGPRLWWSQLYDEEAHCRIQKTLLRSKPRENPLKMQKSCKVINIQKLEFHKTE